MRFRRTHADRDSDCHAMLCRPNKTSQDMSSNPSLVFIHDPVIFKSLCRAIMDPTAPAFMEQLARAVGHEARAPSASSPRAAGSSAAPGLQKQQQQRPVFGFAGSAAAAVDLPAAGLSYRTMLQQLLQPALLNMLLLLQPWGALWLTSCMRRVALAAGEA